MSNLSGIAAAERPHEALRAFGGLPAELRKEKWILILRLNAAIKSDDEDEYISALSDFRKVFPSETWIEFLSVDYYLEKKEFDQALAAIDSQAAAIGGDPYLDVMRANALLSADRTEDALKAVRTAMNADPTLQDAHWTLLEIRLQQKDFREALNCMKDIDSRFVCDWAGMEQNLQYAEFIKSPQYAEWLAHRANKRKTSK